MKPIKHIADIKGDAFDKLIDDVSDKLTVLMNSIINEYSLCPLCAHNIVISMCEKYIDATMEDDNGVRH